VRQKLHASVRDFFASLSAALRKSAFSDATGRRWCIQRIRPDIARAHLIRINCRGFLRSRANASVRANCKRLIVSTRKNPRNARTNRWRTWKLHSSILLLCHVSTGNSTRSCSMADNLCLTRKQSACRLSRLYMFYRYVYVYRYMFIDIYTHIYVHISLLVIAKQCKLPMILMMQFLPLAVCNNRQFSPQEKNSLLEGVFRRNSLSLFVIIAGNAMNYVTRKKLITRAESNCMGRSDSLSRSRPTLFQWGMESLDAHPVPRQRGYLTCSSNDSWN